MPLRPSEAPVCAQLTECKRIVTETVRSDGESFPRYRDSTCTPAGRDCVLVRQFWISVDERGNHGQVARDSFLYIHLERFELVACRRVEVFRLHLVWDLRILMLRTYRA